MNDLQLRPAQEKILEYENGRIAISAVPGSGKTFTLSTGSEVDWGRPYQPQPSELFLCVGISLNYFEEEGWQ